MKKNVFFRRMLLSAMLLAPMDASAQVTIGSSGLPQATLDVVASKTDGSTAEGIIAPRLTLAQLKAADARYLDAQTGAIVYVTDATGGTTAKTANVTAAGYYYFDGTVWQKMGGMVAADMPDAVTADNGLTENPNNNIQLGGTLTKNTTIDLGTFSLTHSGTGKTVISTPLQYNNSGASAGAGKVLTSDASGNATWQDPRIPIGTDPTPYTAEDGWTITSQNLTYYGNLVTVRARFLRTGAAVTSTPSAGLLIGHIKSEYAPFPNANVSCISPIMESQYGIFIDNPGIIASCLTDTTLRLYFPTRMSITVNTNEIVFITLTFIHK